MVAKKKVYIYKVPEYFRRHHLGFEECTLTEKVFIDHISKFHVVADITQADFAFIPALLASYFYAHNQDQSSFNAAWATIKLAPEDIRVKVPHFVLYSYVLINIDFSYIPKDIKILAYETEVTLLNLMSTGSKDGKLEQKVEDYRTSSNLVNNGCFNRIVAIPYNLAAQPSYWKTITEIREHIFSEDLFVDAWLNFDSRFELIFVGDLLSNRTDSLRVRAELIAKLEGAFRGDLLVRDPRSTVISEHYKVGKLALVLRGDTPTRKAFYTALAMGCIPVIFESGLIHYAELYGGYLDVESAVVTIPDVYTSVDSDYVNLLEKRIKQILKNKDFLRRRLENGIKLFNNLNYNNITNGVSTPVLYSVSSVLGVAARAVWKPPFVYCYPSPREVCEDLLPACISPQEILPQDLLSNNGGFGSKTGNGLYQTSQYSLEIIWHNRIKRYNYLTSCIEKADLCFIPCYSFLAAWKVCQFVYSCQTVVSILKFLANKFPAWRKSLIPHIFVFSDVMWDDERVYNHHIRMPDNTWTLTLESVRSNRFNNKLMTVPYPSEFHFELNEEFDAHWERFENSVRSILLAYIGRERWPIHEIDKADGFCCEIIANEPGFWKSANITEITEKVIDLYSNSVFSLQPFGDRGTRRGFYQSLLVGCIPVIFNDNFDSYCSLYGGFNIKKIAIVLDKALVGDVVAVLRKVDCKTIHEYKCNIRKYLRSIQYSNFNDRFDAVGTVLDLLRIRQDTGIDNRIFDNY